MQWCKYECIVEVPLLWEYITQHSFIIQKCDELDIEVAESDE